MSWIFERKPFADWMIEVMERVPDHDEEEIYAERGIMGASLDFEEFSGVYRTTFQNGRECEQFSLLCKDTDYALLWVQIFKNGDVQYISHMPSMININRRKKRVEITPLAYCKVDRKEGVISFIDIED